jgi:type VI secretion system secreted protein VgrG
MGDLSQAGRAAQLTTPLGDNVLCLRRFSGTEGLSENFEFFVDAVSETQDINFDKALGQSCTIQLKTCDAQQRFFSGILTDARWVGRAEDYFEYRIALRPWFWLLNHRANCQIFLEKDVTQIIQQIFTDAGYSSGDHFRFATQDIYDVIPYCVQYRESDLAFVSRLMEQYGIYYFFEHSDGKHVMVLADSLSSHTPIPELQKNGLPFRPLTVDRNLSQQRLFEWTSDRRFRTGKVTYNDYDYLAPGKSLKAEKKGEETYTHSEYEVYDYPGKYDRKDMGENFAKIRLQAEQAIDHRRLTNGDAPSVIPGGFVEVKEIFDDKGQPVGQENQEYLVVRAAHRFGMQNYRSVNARSDRQVDQESQAYQGSYEFLPSSRPFRALPMTARPHIYGIQTAKVVAKKGDEGEEISTDENGHIWVQFYWDREPKVSCPIRVAQSWSGKKWGEQHIPRIGMEVVVEFLEGDPDRPLVVGCVYNGDNKYPYDLPDEKTKSGWKSDSSKGHDGYNELMFEDKKGSELIRMHAQKDHLVQINDSQTGYVGATELNSPYDGGDQTWTVGHNRTWTIQKGDDYLHVQKGNLSIDVDEGNHALDVKLGDISVKADAGNITMEAAQTITIKVGQSSITLDQSSIKISAMMVQIQGQLQAQVKSVMTQIEGDAMLQLSGGIVMIG